MRKNSVFMRGLYVSIPFFACAAIVSVIINYFLGASECGFFEQLGIVSGSTLIGSPFVYFSGKKGGEWRTIWAGRQLVIFSLIGLSIVLFYAMM